VSDLDAAVKFYGTVLDVTLESLPSSDPAIEMMLFPMLMAGGEGEDCGSMVSGACGALVKMEGCNPGPRGTLVYFSCDDCAEDEARVADAGGQVVKPKFGIGDYGFISLISDPEGNMIGLHSQS